MGKVSKKLIAAPAVLALGFALASCGDDDEDPIDDIIGDDDNGEVDDDNDDDNGLPDDQIDDDVDLELTSIGELGDIITGEDDRTLYLFTDDEGAGESTCYDECADAWPPLLITEDGDVDAEDGLDQGLVSVTERDDGTWQVTYNDHPLYYYLEDTREGEVMGQGVDDAWYIVDSNGQPITDEVDTGGY